MIFDDIISYLSCEYQKGKTWQQIGEEHGLSFSYVRDLAQRRRRVEGITLETFFKLFPRAQISLTGSVSAATMPAADMVPRSELLDLREKYANLRDQYQDLREEYLDLKSRPLPAVLHHTEPAALYHVSTSSKSKP